MHDSSRTLTPTRDCFHWIVELFGLPELHVGDLMLFKNMHTYTVAASALKRSQRWIVYCMISGTTWQPMQEMWNNIRTVVDEQDISALFVSYARMSTKWHPATLLPLLSIYIYHSLAVDCECSLN